jgi:hypothetical protein
VNVPGRQGEHHGATALVQFRAAHLVHRAPA